MKPYTYLLVDFLAVIVCFLFSFHPKIKFNKHFGAYLKAAVCVAVPFIVWDIWFTDRGVWWFNKDYTIGYGLLGLPVEEWLFFFCIPFSCVFTSYCLNKFFNLDWADRYGKFLSPVLLLLCLVVIFRAHDRMYPLITFSFTAFTVIYFQYIAKAKWVGRVSFCYLVLLPGFFSVNGVLTGTGLDAPIVNYNPLEILNIRMLTIPVEDVFYGYTQFMIVMALFYRFRKDSPEMAHGTL